MLAHLGDIEVDKGESLTRGDRVGSLGSTGAIDFPAVRVESYVNGEVVNPEYTLRLSTNGLDLPRQIPEEDVEMPDEGDMKIDPDILE